VSTGTVIGANDSRKLRLTGDVDAVAVMPPDTPVEKLSSPKDGLSEQLVVSPSNAMGKRQTIRAAVPNAAPRVTL
jgi:hypothetical protein